MSAATATVVCFRVLSLS